MLKYSTVSVLLVLASLVWSAKAEAPTSQVLANALQFIKGKDATDPYDLTDSMTEAIVKSIDQDLSEMREKDFIKLYDSSINRPCSKFTKEHQEPESEAESFFVDGRNAYSFVQMEYERKKHPRAAPPSSFSEVKQKQPAETFKLLDNANEYLAKQKRDELSVTKSMADAIQDYHENLNDSKELTAKLFQKIFNEKVNWPCTPITGYHGPKSDESVHYNKLCRLFEDIEATELSWFKYTQVDLE